MRSVLFAAPLIVATAYGQLCTANDTEAGFVGFMQGFQSDTTATDTECYGKVQVQVAKVELLAASFANIADDPFASLYLGSDITVASTDVFTYCQTTNFAKQIATKFSTLAGFFDLVATVGVAFFKNYRTPDEENKLYAAINNLSLTTPDTDCVVFSRYLGEVLHYSFNYEVPPALYIDQLQSNLVDDMFQ